MIRFTDNKNDIIPLWQEAFGDSREDIEFFIDNVENADCLAYYNDNSIVSMLYLVECFVNGTAGKYIYAACTAKKCRGFGIMSALLAYSRNCGYNFICLIPANEGLIEYYAKRGLTVKFDINDIKFNQIPEIKEYLFEGCELKKPVALMYKGE